MGFSGPIRKTSRATAKAQELRDEAQEIDEKHHQLKVDFLRRDAERRK